MACSQHGAASPWNGAHGHGPRRRNFTRPRRGDCAHGITRKRHQTLRTQTVKPLISLVLCASAMLAAGNPKLGPKIKLFNGKNLDGFYTFLEKHGKNNDPDHVFRVENGAVHVSGAEFGYFITEKEYGDYYLHVMFKWGQHTYDPRKDKARDSGVLFHVNGDDKVWPHSIEFQMIEGGTGDIILVGETRLTVKGETKDKGRFDRFG